MTKIADHIDGSEVGDKEFVQKLIRYEAQRQRLVFCC